MHNGHVARVRFEACVESAAAASASARGGADRIELCADLDAGGTTPRRHEVEACAAAVAVPVFVMARVRAGSFVYTADEVRATLADIHALKAAGASGIVLGALSPDGTVDAGVTAQLIAAARPLPVTFHRAFDDTRDLDEALDTLLALGVDRVLTSGGAPTALEGAATLRRLTGRAAGHLVVVAGGGVRAHNVQAVLRASGVGEVHARLLAGRCDTPAAAAALTGAVREIIAVLDRPDLHGPDDIQPRIGRVGV